MAFMDGLLGGILQNNWNTAAQNSQRDWMQQMASTGYQRAVADLKAAGLNPMLAYSNGSASSPSGSAATMVNPMSNAVHSAQAQSQLDATVENLKANTDLARTKSYTESATQDLLTQQVENQSLQNKLAAATMPYNIALSKFGSSTASANSALAAASVPAAMNEADFNKSVQKMPFVRNLLGTIQDVLGTAHSAKSLATPASR